MDGYAFEVDASGTMAIQGTIRADELFKGIQQEAAKLARPLPIVSDPESAFIASVPAVTARLAPLKMIRAQRRKSTTPDLRMN